MGYPQAPVYIPVDICGTSLWNIGGDPRHMCHSSHHVSFVTPCDNRHIDCSNRVTIVTKVDKVPTYVPSHQDAF
jgi:hypothetical protein